ncbi:hypothetical protein VTO73DRAFT_9175 [Trametes versicolor]
MTSSLPKSLPRKLKYEPDPPGLDLALKAVLAASTTGQPFEDVKYYAFSRRTSDRSQAYGPMPLLANNALLQRVLSPFSNAVSADPSDGFAESRVTNLDDSYPSGRPSFTEEYGYMSDSDLEEDETMAKEDTQEELRPTNGDAPSTRVPASPVANEGRKEDPQVILAKHPEDHPSGEQARPSSSEPIRPDGIRQTRLGRVVFLDDIAYKTWQAFIIYAYFGQASLQFASLKSGTQNEPPATAPKPGGIPSAQCSPKSMYRLAEKYGIASLERVALNAILKKLTIANILPEVFSNFTSLYPAVKKEEEKYLHAWIHHESVKSRIAFYIGELEKGRLPDGSAEIVTRLLHAALVPRDTLTFGSLKPPTVKPTLGTEELTMVCPGGDRTRRVRGGRSGSNATGIHAPKALRCLENAVHALASGVASLML